MLRPRPEGATKRVENRDEHYHPDVTGQQPLALSAGPCKLTPASESYSPMGSDRQGKTTESASGDGYPTEADSRVFDLRSGY